MEQFRVFRHVSTGEVMVYIGTYETNTPREAIQHAINDDPQTGGGVHRPVYEAHVLRNASIFGVRFRNERFTDSITPMPAAERALVDNLIGDPATLTA